MKLFLVLQWRVDLVAAWLRRTGGTQHIEYGFLRPWKAILMLSAAFQPVYGIQMSQMAAYGGGLSPSSPNRFPPMLSVMRDAAVCMESRAR